MVASLASRRAIWTAVAVWEPAFGWFRVNVGWSGIVHHLTPDQLVTWLVDELYGRRVLAALHLRPPQGSEDGPFLLVIAS